MMFVNYEYDNPVISQRRTGTSGNPYKPITETLIVNNDARVILTEIPFEYDGVLVTDESGSWFETKMGTPKENQFKVNYINKIVEFHESNIGKQLTFQYTGTGLIYLPLSMIYTEKNNGVVTRTLRELTDGAEEATNHANQQGDYAKEQGDHAKSEGDRVQNIVDHTEYIGEWSSNTVYYKNNFVKLAGATFISLTDNNYGNEPDPNQDTTHWGVVAKSGDVSEEELNYNLDKKINVNGSTDSLKFGNFTLKYNSSLNSLDFEVD